MEVKKLERTDYYWTTWLESVMSFAWVAYSPSHFWLSGEIKGFLRNDGTFIISKVASGSSYVVEILHPNYLYEPVKVEINNKGKFRARKVNVSSSPSLLEINDSSITSFLECSTIASSSSSLPIEVESADNIQVLSTAWAVEGDRFPVLSDDPHDDSAFDSSRFVAENHERSWDEKGDGESSVTKARRGNARHEWNDLEDLWWWNSSPKACNQREQRKQS